MWGNRDKEILAEIRRVYEVQRQILSYLRPKPLTHGIVVRFTGALPMQPNNTCVLTVGQTSQAVLLPLLADGITPSGGVVSNVVYQFNDPSATVVLNADGISATVTGVAPSSGPVTGTATCTVTDTDTVVSQWSQPFTVQVNAQQLQLTQSVAVQFSDPTGPGSAPSVPTKPLNE